MLLSEPAMTLEKVADTFGKEIAEKIKNNEGEDRPILADDPDSGTEKVLRGDNLRVGGKGMREFYDKIIPQFANKYVKKWGSKVEESTSIRARRATPRGRVAAASILSRFPPKWTIPSAAIKFNGRQPGKPLQRLTIMMRPTRRMRS